MKKSFVKKGLALLLSVLVAMTVFVGCGNKQTTTSSNTNSTNSTQTNNNQSSNTQTEQKKDPKDFKGTLNVWSFTDELKSAGMIEAFNKVYPNVEIKLNVIPMQQNAYSTKLAAVLKSGVGAPDVFTAEVSFVKKFVNLNYYENLSQAPYNAEELTKNMVPYTVDLGRNDSDKSIRALSWQATPGGMFYRRSLAKQYLGTDDPDKISDMMKTMDDFIKLGKTLKEKSNGKVKLLAGYAELSNVARGSRTEPWVKDKTLVIDQKMMEYLDQGMQIRKEGLDAKLDQWTPAWSAAMAKDEVFGFMLPTWGLHYVIAANAPKTKGDWGLAKAPTPYYWGGTWIGIYKNSKNKELAWEFVKFITTNKDFLSSYAKAKGDFVNNMDVIKEIATSDAGKVEFLGGQNAYKTYSEMLSIITGKLVTNYDETIQNKWDDNMKLYVNGQKTKEQMLEQFKKDVKTAFPELNVK
jgi:multiple sugar transport system substrate-binding protein